MRKFYFFTILCLPLVGSSQNLTPSVVNSAGAVFKTDNVVLSTSIGESVTAELLSGSTLLTQGFLQPFKSDLPTSLRLLSTANNNFSIFPSPSSNEISIDFEDKSVKVNKVEIFAADGRLVLTEVVNSNTILINALSDGIYWIKPISASYLFGVKKFVKISN